MGDWMMMIAVCCDCLKVWETEKVTILLIRIPVPVVVTLHPTRLYKEGHSSKGQMTLRWLRIIAHNVLFDDFCGKCHSDSYWHRIWMFARWACHGDGLITHTSPTSIRGWGLWRIRVTNETFSRSQTIFPVAWSGTVPPYGGLLSLSLCSLWLYHTPHHHGIPLSTTEEGGRYRSTLYT